MKNRLKTIDYNGTGIIFTADGWINATATALAFGKQGMENFLRSSSYLEYAQAVADGCSVNITELKNVVKGKGKEQGTFLHPDLAVMFARWISPAFAYWCDKQVATLIQRLREVPARIEQERTKKLQKIGRPAEAIAARNQGVGVRNGFTGCLQRHGVSNKGFGDCTKAHYFPLFGGGTDVIREKLQVPDKASVRDYMTPAQLSAISLSEALSVEHIDKQGVYGDNACVEICNKVGREVAKLVVDTRRGLSL